MLSMATNFSDALGTFERTACLSQYDIQNSGSGMRNSTGNTIVRVKINLLRRQGM